MCSLEIDIRTILQNDDPEIVPVSFQHHLNRVKVPAYYIEQDNIIEQPGGGGAS